MIPPIRTTKLYMPRQRQHAVMRTRLFERMNEGRQGKLTLVTAPAGYGKTTLVSEWLAHTGCAAAWISLDDADNDPIRFLAYLIAALQTIERTVGRSVFGALHAPQPPSAQAVLTEVLNDMASIADSFVLVLDDYHVITHRPTLDIVRELTEYQPPHMQLIITTRQEPPLLPVARMRARQQLVDLRAYDLRFNAPEAAAFLNETMGLDLSRQDVKLLVSRTEGWVAGLQLTAISLQGHADADAFIQSFTGSHRFVLDYLMEDVLNQLPEHIQRFLLETSVLDRLCGSLCDAVSRSESASGQDMLEQLERANLFIVPLDHERRWYRYHHLFGEMLRNRLTGSGGEAISDLHLRASAWYEENGLELEAFQHAAAARDIDRAARLLEGNGMPLYYRGTITPILSWIESLERQDMDKRPILWIMHAAMLLMLGRIATVEEKLQAAEAALLSLELNDKTRDIMGRIAANRGMIAVSRHRVDLIIPEARRALNLLHSDSLPARAAASWMLGYAQLLQGEQSAARQSLTRALASSQAIGHVMITVMSTISLGMIDERGNRLKAAAETYRRALEHAGDPPLPVAAEAYLGLARIHYEWNDLAAAKRCGEQALALARFMEQTDRVAACQLFLARLSLANGDIAAASDMLEQIERYMQDNGFMQLNPDLAAVRAMMLIGQGQLAEAAACTQSEPHPLIHARVLLAQAEPAAAHVVLDHLLQRSEPRVWQDEQLRAKMLLAIVQQALGRMNEAIMLLQEVMLVAEREQLIRVFLDEGEPMRLLVSEGAARGVSPAYVAKLLAAWSTEPGAVDVSKSNSDARLIEPLSERETEILRLIAQGLSNQEISERLFLALSTVKGHNQNLFGKLQVQRRTEAVARARELGLLQS